MDPVIYILISVFAVPLILGIFWGGKKLGVIETKVKNIEGDIGDIKKDINAIRNGK